MSCSHGLVARVIAATAFASVLSGAVPTSQSQVPSERPAGLTVDFIAVHNDGTPVADLQSGDVEVRIGGRLRSIRSLRRVSAAAGPARTDARVMPAPYGTNDTVASGRSFVFVVDEESMRAGQVALLKSAVDGLLAGFMPHDRAMVAALPFGGVHSEFTSDTRRIGQAVTLVSGKGTRDETGSDLACRTRRFLESLDVFLRRHAGRSSPLTVVLFTAGLAAPRRDAAMAEAPGMCELLVSHFQQVTIAAGAARANFFVVQPDDVGMGAERWRESIGGTGYLGSDNPLEGVENLAGVTGGVRLPLNATGTASLLRVAKESSAYYIAEIAPEPNEAVGRSRPLAVRVLRRDVTVRARPQITFLDQPAPIPGGRLALPDLLLSAETFTDVRLRVAGFTARESDGRLRVGVVVEPVDDGSPLAAVGAVLVDHGDVTARWVASDTLSRPLIGAMPAAAGTYRLRVVAIDTSGRIGAAEDVVEVGLTPLGPLSLGSLLLAISRHDILLPQLEFADEPTAIASFDIYGGAAGMPMTAVVEVARDRDGPAIVTLPLALVRANADRVVAKGAVPIGALPPGDYVVRGVLRLEDGSTGRVMRTLRKIDR